MSPTDKCLIKCIDKILKNGTHQEACSRTHIHGLITERRRCFFFCLFCCIYCRFCCWSFISLALFETYLLSFFLSFGLPFLIHLKCAPHFFRSLIFATQSIQIRLHAINLLWPVCEWQMRAWARTTIMNLDSRLSNCELSADFHTSNHITVQQNEKPNNSTDLHAICGCRRRRRCCCYSLFFFTICNAYLFSRFALITILIWVSILPCC